MSKKCNSKCTKHTKFGTLFEVEMSKKVHAAVARSTFRSQKWRKLRGSEHFWMFGCHFGWQGILHLAKHEGVVAVYNHHYTTLPYTTLEYATLHYPTLHYTTQLQLHYTTLHPAVVGEVTDQVTTATIATIPKTQLQPPLGPSVDSLCHP